MRVNQVVLVPSVPSIGAGGLVFGRFSEGEAVHGYMESLYEHLEEDRIPVRYHHDLEPFQPNSLILYCQIGFERILSKSKCNAASVSYIGSHSQGLAALLCEALADWGRSYVDFHHKTANPKEESKIVHEGSFGVVIKPFRLNGPNIEEYMLSLDQLGKTIAYSVYEFMVGRSELPSVMKTDA